MAFQIAATAGAPSMSEDDASMVASGFELIPTEMEGFVSTRTMPKVLCCLCGVSIDPNAANMCVNCLRGQVDITENIPKSLILHQCRGCQRILRPPWVACEPESRELLAVCLKKITGLNKVKLIDAGFIWTEPHSRRLKVKLTIQKEVLNGVKLQQVFPVEFVLQNQQCDACARSFTDHIWRAMVQVRQKVDHKRTFFLLEQLILKHSAHEKCISVEQVPAGVDFAFSERSHAVKFMDFLGTMVPTRWKSAKQLISEDIQNANKNYKFTYAVEVVPLCKDDLVVLPRALAASLGNISRLALVLRIAANVGLLDPRSLQVAELSADKYWREPFRAWLSSARLEEFVVLDITPVTVAPITGTALRRKQGAKGRKGRASARDRLEELKELQLMGRPQSSQQTSSGTSVAGSLAGKRPRGADSVLGSRASVAPSAAASSKRGGGGASGTGASFGGRGGGFTGAVSLAGGNVAFNMGSTVATTVVGGPRGRMLLADAEVMRVRDMGSSDTRFTVRTHLGNILRPGDTVLGYDLSKAVVLDEGGGEEESAGSSRKGGRGEPGAGAASGGSGSAAASIQRAVDIVLVRKVYPRKEDRIVAEREMDAEAAAAALAAASAAAAASTAGSGGGDDEMDGAASSAATAAAAAAGAIKRRQRVWKLKRFEDAVPSRGAAAASSASFAKAGGRAASGARARGAAGEAEERDAADFEAFLREIEEDPALRKHINLYKDADAIQSRSAAAATGAASATKRGRTAAAAAAAAPASTSSAAAATLGGTSAAAAQTRASDSDDDDGDDTEEDEKDEFPDIQLDELLDDLTLGDSTDTSRHSSSSASASAAAVSRGGERATGGHALVAEIGPIAEEEGGGASDADDCDNDDNNGDDDDDDEEGRDDQQQQQSTSGDGGVIGGDSTTAEGKDGGPHE